MTVILQLLGSLVALLAAYGLYRGLKLVYEELTSPLRDLPGPKNVSLIYGNLWELWETRNSVILDEWVKEYGPTMQLAGLFGVKGLYTTDTKALKHILVNSDIYQKPGLLRSSINRLSGPGLAMVEGHVHKRQRRIMNPAFGPSQIRELTEIFVAKSIELRDIWAADNANQGGTSQVEALSWLSRTTLDIIGLAGFNYRFDALSDDSERNELSAAFAVLFNGGSRRTILFRLIRACFPFLPPLRIKYDIVREQARKIMTRIGNQLLQESKASIHEKSAWKARDLLSLLVKSNMATDVPEHQRMTDEEVLAQISTFLIAGHETTGVTATWALYALTQDKAAQNKLREELLAVDTENPTMDQLNALPYLDMVVRETMRIHPAAASTIRAAVKDDIVPLNNPFTDRKGVMHDTVRVRKGQVLMVPILAVNRDKSIWGEDAMLFRPERWEKIPEAAGEIPGVWSNMLTFIGGPRGCIGYRFSVVEIKALLFTLVRAFEFELAVPANDIVKGTLTIQRPVLVTDPAGGNQMPLLITPVVRS